MKLNTCQQETFDEIDKFLSDPDRKFLVIVGPGGTGKTSAVSEYVKQHKSRMKRVVLTAPTNTATGVLEGFLGDADGFIPTMTIYKLLGLVVGADGEVKRAFRANDGKVDLFDTVIVDEGSMAGIQLTEVIEERVYERRNLKFIIMGDPCQLNPVNETSSSLLQLGTIKHLHEDMRSGNGPLLQVKRAVRDLAIARNEGKKTKSHKVDLSTNLNDDESGVHFLSGKFFTEAVLDMFDSEEYKADPNFVRVLAWRNDEVDRWNRLIRTRIYGKGCDPYIVGERVNVLTPVVIDEIVHFHTDQQAIIKDIAVSTYQDYTDQDATTEEARTYDVWRVTLENPENGRTCIVPVMHKKGERKFYKRLDFLADKANKKQRPWNMFHAFKDIFTLIRPIHATTVHKSQGQTYTCTFLDAKDIMKNKNVCERSRLLYVGASRPTTDLVTNLKSVY